MVAVVERIGREDLAAESFAEALRVAEAILFASAEPVAEADLAGRLPEGTDVKAVLSRLEGIYGSRGVNLVKVAGQWMFRTAPDLAFVLAREVTEAKRLSRAALEMLAIIAYHQPVTRAEIEEIRGVTTSRGTLDALLETGWVRLRGRRKAPGRPVTYGTTADFLTHFGLDTIADLPGLDELRGAGFFDGQIPAGFGVPMPNDDQALSEDEEPLDDELFSPLPPEPDEDADNS